MRKFLSLFVLSLMTVSVFGGPRSVEDMMEAARKVIGHRPSSHAVKENRSLEVLKKGQMLNVIGYRDGGFAVIASDDKFAPVLGYSDTKNSGMENILSLSTSSLQPDGTSQCLSTRSL